MSSKIPFLTKPIFSIIITITIILIFLFVSTFLSNTNIITYTTTNDLQLNNLTLTSTQVTQKTLQKTDKKTSVLPYVNDSTISPTSLKLLPPCTSNFTHYCPCQDQARIRRFSTKRYFNRERHCPEDGEKVKCLIPKPKGYRRPFPWPKSKDMAWYNNVPFKKLSVEKKLQNWVRLEGDLLVFPGGGTSFRHGVKEYIGLINKILPLGDGSIRTVLDIGCGVASFGAGLLDYDILTMSVAPLDLHEAQVQFALERGLPAMLGILSTYRLPYPSRSFDLAHCARCLVKWADYDGLYLLEIDRILRPGGYWVLSGPPIYWRSRYKGWERTPQDLEGEQMALEDLARRMCWKKIAENGPIAVWQKPTNHVHCAHKLKAWKSLQFCVDNDPDAAWYTQMKPCINRLPEVQDVTHVSGGHLENWPGRIIAAPPRIIHSKNGTVTSETFDEDNHIWQQRVQQYESVLGSLLKGEYRNIMDMNAGFGGFAASLSSHSVWVMSVVPFDSKDNTLGIIYERGLIGSYMNWCEAFSTYPRTYDLIHANGVFSMYMNKCDILDILLEMYRILRPHGAVIVRDHVDILVKVKDLMAQMKWTGKLMHSEHGSDHPEKVLFVDNSNNR